MTRVLIVALVVLANMALAPPLAGSAEQTGITAEIHEGNCDDIGEVVAPLVEARLPARDRRGNAAAMPAANSFTTVPISLEALTASDHAIVVPFPVRDEIVACGDIGGTLTEAGALMVGTSPQGKTKVSGIAYLSPGADPAARFAAVLAGRDSADCLAGPLAGSFVARGGQGAGVMMENFSVTVTFVNPMQQSETPWDYGFAFHRVGDTFQSIYVDSKGF